MKQPTYSQFAYLSPFELKDQLIAIATSDAQRLMLNAGRGNPNFLATLAALGVPQPRRLLDARGRALLFVSRQRLRRPAGSATGIVQRFDAYATAHRLTDGVRFLRSAISYVKDQLGLDQDAFLFEMVGAFLGCNYPTPPRMLVHTEEIVKAYLRAGDVRGGAAQRRRSRCSRPKAARRR